MSPHPSNVNMPRHAPGRFPSPSRAPGPAQRCPRRDRAERTPLPSGQGLARHLNRCLGGRRAARAPFSVQVAPLRPLTRGQEPSGVTLYPQSERREQRRHRLTRRAPPSPPLPALTRLRGPSITSMDGGGCGHMGEGRSPVPPARPGASRPQRGL